MPSETGEHVIGEVEALVALAADRDLPCPVCGDSLRGLIGAACPHCGAELHVRVGMTDVGHGWWIAAVLGPAGLCGLFAFVGLIQLVALLSGDLGGGSAAFAGTMVAAIMEGVVTAALVQWRRDFLRKPRGERVWGAIVSWLVALLVAMLLVGLFLGGSL